MYDKSNIYDPFVMTNCNIKSNIYDPFITVDGISKSNIFVRYDEW
jgi:hypothetical protein